MCPLLVDKHALSESFTDFLQHYLSHHKQFVLIFVGISSSKSTGKQNFISRKAIVSHINPYESTSLTSHMVLETDIFEGRGEVSVHTNSLS